MAQHVREKNWVNLRKHVGYHSIKLAAHASTVTEVETRDRHSLVSLAAPNEVDDKDARHLRDEQVSQIFFNCLVTELLVAATFNDTSTTTPPTCVPNMTHPRFLVENLTSHNLTDHALRQLGVKIAGEVGPNMTGVSARVSHEGHIIPAARIIALYALYIDAHVLHNMHTAFTPALWYSMHPSCCRRHDLLRWRQPDGPYHDCHGHD